MNFGRDSHTATLLPNGQVLVAGGFDNHGYVTAELYDPATGALEGDRQPEHWALTVHGDFAAERTNIGGRQYGSTTPCGTIRSGDWGMDGNRQHGQLHTRVKRRHYCRVGKCW